MLFWFRYAYCRVRCMMIQKTYCIRLVTTYQKLIRQWNHLSRNRDSSIAVTTSSTLYHQFDSCIKSMEAPSIWDSALPNFEFLDLHKVALLARIQIHFILYHLFQQPVQDIRTLRGGIYSLFLLVTPLSHHLDYR